MSFEGAGEKKDKPQPVPPDRPRKPPVEPPPDQPGIPPGEPDPRPKGDPPPNEPTRLTLPPAGYNPRPCRSRRRPSPRRSFAAI